MEDGNLAVMARSDDVINVAGHRLSTGALEEVLDMDIFWTLATKDDINVVQVPLRNDYLLLARLHIV